MLHPSYTDLMKVVNKDVERRENKDTSTVVIRSLWQHRNVPDN